MNDVDDIDPDRSAETPTDFPVDDGELLEDRYEIDERLGSGGQGISYRGTDTETGRDVVVKRLAVEAVDQWKTVELFERSMEVLQKLDHPQIPDYVDALERDADGDAPTELFIVRGYAPGESLRDAVDDGERFTEQEVRSIARELLEILDYLHGRDPPVVHRDIKPGNVVRNAEGDLALVDFGAVQESLLDDSSGSTVVGTAGYVPPEQLTGDATPKSDLYAVGATLVHLLTHKDPSDLPVERMTIQFRDHTDVSEGFAAWLDGLIDPEPGSRFDDAARALEALDDPEAGTLQRIDESRAYPTLAGGPPDNSEPELDVDETVEIRIPGTRYRLHDMLVAGWFVVGGMGLVVALPWIQTLSIAAPLILAWGATLAVSLLALVLRLVHSNRDLFVEIDDEGVAVGRLVGSRYRTHYHDSLENFPGFDEAPFTTKETYETEDVGPFTSAQQKRKRVLSESHDPSATFALAGEDDFLVVVPPDREGWKSEELEVDDFPFVLQGAAETLTLAERQWLIDAVDDAVARERERASQTPKSPEETEKTAKIH